MHNYTLSVKISRYLKIPLVDLCKTSYSRRQSSKEYVTLSITNENAENYKRKYKRFRDGRCKF